MCGRFAIDKDANELIEEFVAEGGDVRDWVASWNLAPTQNVLAVIESAKGDDAPVRRLEPARWSLTPGWSKSLKTKFPTFNARSEGLAEKAMWKGPLKSKRAIIPATGYYEWQTDETGAKKPFYISLSAGETIAMAGLYSWWPDHSKAEDDPAFWTLTVSILTSDAVDELVGIHDRNPVPLPADWWSIWLDPGIEGDQDLVDEAVLQALPVAERLQFHEVAPLKGDGVQLVKQIGSTHEG